MGTAFVLLPLLSPSFILINPNIIIQQLCTYIYIYTYFFPLRPTAHNYLYNNKDYNFRFAPKILIFSTWYLPVRFDALRTPSSRPDIHNPSAWIHEPYTISKVLLGQVSTSSLWCVTYSIFTTRYAQPASLNTPILHHIQSASHPSIYKSATMYTVLHLRGPICTARQPGYMNLTPYSKCFLAWFTSPLRCVPYSIFVARHAQPFSLATRTLSKLCYTNLTYGQDCLRF